MDERERRDVWPENAYRGAVILATFIAAFAFWFSQRQEGEPQTAAIQALNRTIVLANRPEPRITGAATDPSGSIRFHVRNLGAGAGQHVDVVGLRLLRGLKHADVGNACPARMEPYIQGTGRPGPAIEAHGELDILVPIPTAAAASEYVLVAGLRYLSEIEGRWICNSFVITGYRPGSGAIGAPSILTVAPDR